MTVNMNVDEIMKIIPHRYPFLMVDRLVELEPGVKAVGIKNLTINEPFFTGHFPGQPVMPGVLMIEAMAQVGACALLSQPEHQGQIAMFAGVDRIRFKRSALPGETLLISTELTAIKGSIGKGKGKITIDGETVCNGEFMFALVNSRK